MSGNIFASSTVPGIKDRDRDKQVVALWGQSYYLSRHDFTTAYWVKLMIGSTLLMLIVPIYFARLFFSAIQQPQPDPSTFLVKLFPSALRPHQDTFTNTFELAEIPISAVLTRALAISNGTRSRGLLTHALLELQNPELTSFAGPGYGVHLKEMNRGSQLEAFPDGRLPWCGVGGRYDEWGRIRGLRYAYRWITTVDEASLMQIPLEAKNFGRLDLDSLLMGWPALLLERARVDDPLNPVPPKSRRNVYGEAVDRVVKKLCADGGCEWDHQLYGHDKRNNKEEDADTKGDNAQQQLMVSGSDDKELRSPQNLLTDDTVAAFILTSFFAVYAVAREDTNWLAGAVKQLDLCLRGSAKESDQENEEYWMTDAIEFLPTENTLNLEDESKERPSCNPWTWTGAVRVLSVLEGWKPNFNDTATGTDRVKYENWKKMITINLRETMNTMLLGLREENRDTIEVLQFCIDSNNSESCEVSGPGPALTGLLVGSIYRLTQLNMLDDLNVLEWADGLYNTVASHVGSDGNMKIVTQERKHETQSTGLNAGEDQSIVIMMWAARRDCTKAGICSRHKKPSRWQRLKSSVLSIVV